MQWLFYVHWWGVQGYFPEVFLLNYLKFRQPVHIGEKWRRRRACTCTQSHQGTAHQHSWPEPSCSHKQYELAHDKTNKMTLRPAKTQISLGICQVWSVFAVHSMGSQGPKLSSCGQRRLWSDWADARLIWAFPGRLCHFVGFVVRRLSYIELEVASDKEPRLWYYEVAAHACVKIYLLHKANVPFLMGLLNFVFR